jgi:fermentation-respiration switch protein FrsA (DUF1100 family)
VVAGAAADFLRRAYRTPQVFIDHARRIFEAARHPKSFIALDGADHLLMARESDARFVAEVPATWARRYLAVPA